jgi:hypothetical protein
MASNSVPNGELCPTRGGGKSGGGSLFGPVRFPRVDTSYSLTLTRFVSFNTMITLSGTTRTVQNRG